MFRFATVLLLVGAALGRRVTTTTPASMRGWKLLERASPEAGLELLVAVKQENISGLEAVALAVSDPSSPRYGQHLSLEEVHEMVRPSPWSMETVRRWLGEDTVETVTPNGDFLRILLSVAQAESLLNTTYGIYEHEATGRHVMRVIGAFTLPEDVARAVDFVSPTVNFMQGLKAKALVSDSEVGAGSTTPQSLRDLYNLKDVDVGKAQTNSSQAVASFLKTYYSKDDLAKFWMKYPPLAETKFTDVPANQPHAPVDSEAALDTQFIAALGAGVNTEVWTIEGDQPGSPGNEPFLKWILKVSSTARVPDVFSISYGDDEDQVHLDYAQRCNREFAKAAARGISLLAASGDDGAGCGGVYSPTFPASSPWITAVGGLRESYSNPPEEVWPKGGGGFSNYFAPLPFQHSPISSYIQKATMPPQHYWNRSGAAFPDISGHAEGYDVCVDGDFRSVAGTSAACPSVAGVFAILNDARVNAGKSKLGFLNPLIYKHPEGFADITTGHNMFCSASKAFEAISGWDSVTGFGTPDFQKLKDIVMAL